jgi:glycosyltransferase involved in cell wall biosynthesis
VPSVAAPERGRPLNILTFNYEYPPLGGGGGVFHEVMAEELAKRHHVAVITSAFGDLPSIEVRGGVEIHRVPIMARRDPSAASLLSMLAFPPAAWWAASRLMRRTRYDVIHAHFAVPTGPGSLPPAWAARIPHVLSIQGGDIYDPSKRLSPHRNAILRAAVSTILRRSRAVVAASQNMKDNAYRYYRYRGPIEIIPLGIRRPPAVAQASRCALGLPEGSFLAVTVGRLVRRKGLGQLLQALARPECASVHLAIIGSGPEHEPLRSLAESLSLKDRVHFLGRVDEERKWQVLRCADAYVSATLHEGFGLVYLEAMASGLAVITPDHGGQVDFLEDGKSAILVKSGDPRSLVAGIARAVANRNQTREMGERNRTRASAHFIERCAETYEKLYYRVMSESTQSRRFSRGASSLTPGALPLSLASEWAQCATGLAPILGA